MKRIKRISAILILCTLLCLPELHAQISKSLVFERLFYSGYVAMAKIRFTEFLPSTGCHHSVCPHYRHLARP